MSASGSLRAVRITHGFQKEDTILLQEREMVFKLSKSGDELHDEGKELVKRSEYAKACDYLQRSVDKDGGIDDVTAVKVALVDPRDKLTNVNAYKNLIGTRLSMEKFKFGLIEVGRDELRTECELAVRKIEPLSSGDSG